MRLFTVPEVAKLSRMLPQTLRNLCAAGLITPAAPGTTGTGKGHRFSLVQAFALAAGQLYRREGADAGRAAGVTRYLAGLSAEKLEAFFSEGRNFPVPAAMLARAAAEEGLPPLWLPGDMIKPPAAGEVTGEAARLLERLSLPALWAAVQADARKLGDAPKKKKRRRRAASSR